MFGTHDFDCSLSGKISHILCLDFHVEIKIKKKKTLIVIHFLIHCMSITKRYLLCVLKHLHASLVCPCNISHEGTGRELGVNCTKSKNAGVLVFF